MMCANRHPARNPITSVREAVKSDADDLVQIEASAFVEEKRFSTRQIKRLIANPRAVVLVAQAHREAPHRILAYSAALTRQHPRWQSGRIITVAVASPHKGQGIGRTIVTSLIDRLKKEDITRVFLEVRVDNTPAISLYESLGFETTALLVDYYADGAHAIRMRRVGA